MIELFADIPEEVKTITKFWAEVSLAQPDIKDTIRMMDEYYNSCTDEEEKDFVNFYFNMKMQQLIGDLNE